MARRISTRIRDVEAVDDPTDLWWPKPERGKSVNFQSSVSVETAEMIDNLIATREGVWANRSEFGNCAIGFFFDMIRTRMKKNKFKTALKVMRVSAATARTEKKLADISAYLDDTVAIAERLRKMGMLDEAKAKIKAVEKEDWDDSFIDQVVERWLKSQPVVKILTARRGGYGQDE